MTIPFLRTLNIEVTRKCFLDCIHCSALAGEEVKDELSLAEIKNIINDFITLGGDTLEISGGEPFCHKHIWETIQYSKEKGLKVNLFTCGILGKKKASKHKVTKIAERIRQLNVDKVTISLHGSVSETHDSITQRQGSFTNTLNFIKTLVEHGNNVGIHFVPMNPNFEEIEDVIQIAQSLQLKEVGILRFVPQGRGKLNEKWLRLSPVQSTKLVEIITKIRKETEILRVGSHLDFSFIFDKTYTPASCSAGIDKCLIQPNGDVVPCAVFKGLDDFIAGNIRHSPLLEIWEKSKVFDMFRGFDVSKLKGCCAICEYLNICRGRCPAQRIYGNNNFYQGPDPYCPLVILKADSSFNKKPVEGSRRMKIVILGSCKFEKEINEFVEQMKKEYEFLAIPRVMEKHNTEEGYLLARKIFEPAIKNCDEVWIWNQNGYLGEHTLRDIQLASFLKKKIKFLFPP